MSDSSRLRQEKDHFGRVGAEWKMEFARKKRTDSDIQDLPMTHHRKVRKLHQPLALTFIL
jgi:hypothetical protein